MDKFNKRIIGKIIIYALLILGAFITLIPFIWMISTSLKSSSEVLTMPPKWIPEVFRWDNYSKALEVAPFGIYFVNTVIVTVINTVLTVIFVVLASYAFARLNFWGKDLLFSILLATMMIPGEMLIITNYITIVNMGLVNTLTALIVPYIASVFYIYLMRQFFMQIPKELYYAAKVDSCTDWKYLWRVMVPMNKHGIVTIAILNAITSWNAFLWPLIVTNSQEKRVLSIGLIQFQTEAGTHFELLMAAATIIVVPMIIFYLIMRKYIINGVARGGLKG